MTKNKKSRVRVEDYLPLLSKHVFQNQPLKKIRGSLYRAGSQMIVEIHVQDTKADKYFFPVRLEPTDGVYMTLFVCCRERVVFCLEPDMLRELPLFRSKEGKPRFNLVAEHPLNGEAYLFYRKGDLDEAPPINITEFGIPLYDELDLLMSHLT